MSETSGTCSCKERRWFLAGLASGAAALLLGWVVLIGLHALGVL